MRTLYKKLYLNCNPLKNMDEVWNTLQHKKLSLDSISHDLSEIFLRANLELHAIDIFHTSVGKRGPQDIDSSDVCHIDGPVCDELEIHNKWPERYKINFIYAEKGADMLWWEPKTKIKLESRTFSDHKFPYINPYVQWNIKDCDIICQENLNGVYLVETGVPHSVYNTSNKDRFAVSFAITAKNSPIIYDMSFDLIYGNLKSVLLKI